MEKEETSGVWEMFGMLIATVGVAAFLWYIPFLIAAFGVQINEAGEWYCERDGGKTVWFQAENGYWISRCSHEAITSQS